MSGNSEDENSPAKEGSSDSSLGHLPKLFHQIFEKINDQGVLAVLVVCLLSFGCLYKGVSPTAVIILALFGFMAILVSRLAPLILKYQNEVRKLERSSSERQKQIVQKRDRKRARNKPKM